MSIPKENIVPPGGFHFEDKVNRFRVDGHSYQSVAEALLRYRLENKLPVGNPLKDVLDYVCTNWPHFCSAHNPPILGGNATPSISSRISVWLSALYRTARSSGGSENFVAQAEADRRAAICRSCPHNVEWRHGCTGCLASIATLGFTFRAGRASSEEKHLKGCDIIGQENATAVWVRALPPVSPSEYEQLPKHCWRK